MHERWTHDAPLHMQMQPACRDHAPAGRTLCPVFSAKHTGCMLSCGKARGRVRAVVGQLQGHSRSEAHWKWGGDVPSIPVYASPTCMPSFNCRGSPLGSCTCAVTASVVRRHRSAACGSLEGHTCQCSGFCGSCRPPKTEGPGDDTQSTDAYNEPTSDTGGTWREERKPSNRREDGFEASVIAAVNAAVPVQLVDSV